MQCIFCVLKVRRIASLFWRIVEYYSKWLESGVFTGCFLRNDTFFRHNDFDTVELIEKSDCGQFWQSRVTAWKGHNSLRTQHVLRLDSQCCCFLLFLCVFTFVSCIQASWGKWPPISQWMPGLTTKVAAAISKPASPIHQAPTRTPTSPTKATGPTEWSTRRTRTVRLVIPCVNVCPRRQEAWRWENLLDCWCVWAESASVSKLNGSHHWVHQQLFYRCFSTATHYVEMKCLVAFIKLLFSHCHSKGKEAREAFVASTIKVLQNDFIMFRTLNVVIWQILLAF